MMRSKVVNKKKLSSFSLIEILVFISVLTIFLIAGLSVSLYSLQLLKHAEYKTLASFYGQEALEWIKKEKDLNWTIFFNRGSSTGTTYCLNNLSWLQSGNCSNFNLNNFYKREVTLTTVNNSVKVDIYVIWNEKNNLKNINMKTTLNLWE